MPIFFLDLHLRLILKLDMILAVGLDGVFETRSRVVEQRNVRVMDWTDETRRNCPCVLPSPTERELATIPGTEPGTALRVRVEPGRDGYVRLEHLAYNANVGWYTQKSFCIAGELLGELIPALRKADCLTPTAKAKPADASHLLRLVPPVEPDEPAPQRERRSS